MKVELAIIGFVFLALATIWLSMFSFGLINQQSTVLPLIGFGIIMALVAMWAVILKKAAGEKFAKALQKFFKEDNAGTTDRTGASSEHSDADVHGRNATTEGDKHDGN